MKAERYGAPKDKAYTTWALIKKAGKVYAELSQEISKRTAALQSIKEELRRLSPSWDDIKVAYNYLTIHPGHRYVGKDPARNRVGLIGPYPLAAEMRPEKELVIHQSLLLSMTRDIIAEHLYYQFGVNMDGGEEYDSPRLASVLLDGLRELAE